MSELSTVDRIVERSGAPELRALCILHCFRVTIDCAVDKVVDSLVD